MTLRDPELLDLLADRPELLAIADAVAATQQPPKRSPVLRPAARLGAVAVVATVVVAALLVLPQGKHGVVDRALAAIGNGRVVHIVAEGPMGTTYVDLQSGHRRVQYYRLELWADQKRDRFHAISSLNGKLVGDILWPQDAKNGLTVDPVGPSFGADWSGYREALANGRATRVGKGVAYGHRVYWLRFRPVDAKSPRSEVAVDAQTFKPVVFRTYSGPHVIDQHVLLAETTDFAPADFTRRGPEPLIILGPGDGAGSFGITKSGKLSRTVPRGWLTAGTAADGHKLAAVVSQTVTTDGIQLIYGSVDHGFPGPDATTVDELPIPGPDRQMWTHIPADTVQIQLGPTRVSSRVPLQWIGYVVKNGRYVTITTEHGEQAVVAIARSLQRVK